MAAREGVEPTTVRLKVIDATNAPPRPFTILSQGLFFRYHSFLKSLSSTEQFTPFQIPAFSHGLCSLSLSTSSFEFRQLFRMLILCMEQCSSIRKTTN